MSLNAISCADMYLQLDHISLQFPGSPQPRLALDAVSLELKEGQIGALIGPSGCGKTTLLRAVAGLQTLHTGSIRMGGQILSQAAGGAAPAQHVAPEARQIGMVFQDYALFPHLTVQDNVAFGLHQLSRGERKERVQSVLELVGLSHAATRAPHQLSGGQQQRVALARALAPKPRLLLLDEPFSSLDVDLRERLAQELRAILTATQTTALFVTHDQLEAFAIGDVIGVMNHGRLEQWSDPYTTYHRPVSRFVASFIGHSVFAHGKVVTHGEGTEKKSVVETSLGTLEDIDERHFSDAYPGGLCDVLLRADDIVHDDASPVLACIERKAFRGSEFLYTLKLPTGERIQAHVPSHHDHQVGEWIGIRAEVDHVVTFERE